MENLTKKETNLLNACLQINHLSNKDLDKLLDLIDNNLNILDILECTEDLKTIL